MLVELSVVEQRYQAVLAVIRDGRSVVEVASQVGVSRQTVHTWLARYEAGGLAGLANRSHRPESCPHQMSAAVEARVLEWRRVHPGWGPRRLLHELERVGVAPLPSRSAVYRALVRHGLIEENPRRRRAQKWRRWERGVPMELWQMDVVGGILLADGSELKALTGLDDHSRFCVVAGLMPRATSRAVCGHFTAALRRHGVPQEILTDNGKVFTGKYQRPQPVEVLFDRICRENGIDHLLTKPASPTTTGKIERFHRSLRTEFLAGRIFTDQAEAQADLDAWVEQYNTARPHQGIAMVTPAERFHAPRPAAATTAEAARPLSEQAMMDERTGEHWVARRVAANGIISVGWQVFSVGKHRAGDTVDVFVGEQLLHVWSGKELIKTVIRTSKGEIRKKRASVSR
jgi:transposase InsO family protein